MSKISVAVFRRLVEWGCFAACFGALVLLLSSCGGDDEPPTTSAPPPGTASEQTAERPSEPRVETVAEGLDAPWDLAFLPDGRALITEQAGRVKLLDTLETVADVPVVDTAEAGLLGLAVDPGFEENGFVYLYRTVEGGNEVARYRFEDDRLVEDATIVTGIAAAPIHDGGRLAFGPDGYLYITAGDAGEPQRAQDPGSLNGKVLRLDGSRARRGGGRPEVFTLGNRNPQGLDWQPGTDRLYASEHGATGNDEMNLLREGRNYGWPVAQGSDHGRFAAPLAVYTPAIAPSGATFVEAEGSAWTGDFLVACLEGEQIRRLRFDGEEVTVDEALFEGEFGRLRTVVEGPGGLLHVVTSNTDAYGDPRAGDDRVLRIEPPAG